MQGPSHCYPAPRLADNGLASGIFTRGNPTTILLLTLIKKIEREVELANITKKSFLLSFRSLVKIHFIFLVTIFYASYPSQLPLLSLITGRIRVWFLILLVA